MIWSTALDLAVPELLDAYEERDRLLTAFRKILDDPNADPQEIGAMVELDINAEYERAERAEAELAKARAEVDRLKTTMDNLFALFPSGAGHIVDLVRQAIAERDAMREVAETANDLLRRWRARGFPMGGAQLWDDTIEHLERLDSAKKETPK